MTDLRPQFVHFVHAAKDVPEKEHWAIIESSSVHVPSQGHGYPAYTEEYITYTAYFSKEKFEAELKAFVKAGGKAVGIHVEAVIVPSKEVRLSESK